MRFLLKICLIISLTACNNTLSNSFRLEGFAENAKDSGNIILYYFTLKNNEWHEIVDTTKIINGKFLFEGNINGLTTATLVFNDSISNVVIDTRMYLEPTTIKLRINKNQPYAYELLGTKVEKENIELRKELESDEKIQYQYGKYLDNMVGQIKINYDNIPVRDSLISELNQHRKEYIASCAMDKKMLDFIRKHNTYQIIPDLLYLLTNSDSIPIDTIKHIFNYLPKKSKISLMGRLAYMKINETLSIKDSYVGGTAPNFIREDLFKNTIKLSDYRNQRYVLLDFWASWCKPCLNGMPTIKDLYENYSKKGLTIIGISSDEDKDQWTNAVNKYELSKWSQILSQKSENSIFENISKIYDIKSIPFYVLIDKEGKVIARWEHLGEKELSEIDRILKNK